MDLDRIASALGARAARHAGRIQALWGGCGELVRIELTGGPVRSAIVKWARPPAERDESNERKRRSYAIETAFYREIAPRCDASCRVAALLAAFDSAETGEWTLVLEDLDAAGYTVRVDDASPAQLDSALAWLASFHARFVGERFPSLWPTGTYWHLATRRTELAAIDDDALRAVAPRLASRLAKARFHTLLHGDPKEANFCFDGTGTRVAAVDFQYTGPGCGMSDVAYLLYGRADEPADGIDHARLDTYFCHLRRELAPSVDADALEAEWRALYPIARLDFCRFLAGWRPALWRADHRGQRFVRECLGELVTRT